MVVIMCAYVAHVEWTSGRERAIAGVQQIEK